MKLTIAAIGKLKKGPEQDLVARYADRIKASGKAIGLTDIKTIEIPESRAATADLRKAEEAETLLSKLSDKTIIFAFDERGKRPTSREFATAINSHLDGGTTDITLILGGPDGLDAGIRNKADQVISFGSLTMPHQLVRVLVLEQAYRAVTILTNHPYHRD